MTPPVPLGARPTFAFGDRFGFAARAHLAAAQNSGFAPLFAHQSATELAQSGRTPGEVLAAADPAAAAFAAAWGAEAQEIATAEDVAAFAALGFTRFSLDPSAWFIERAEHFSTTELEAAVAALAEDRAMPEGWIELYAGREFPISDTLILRFSAEEIRRLGVKFGWALAFAEELSGHARQACGPRPFEIELSIRRCAARTTPLEHLFVALEARRRGLPLVAIAPRLPGSWESVAEYDGEADELDAALRVHAAIAEAHGPHQVSVAEIEEKDAVLPLLASACGPRLSVKTSAASAMELLRVAVRTAPVLFREILVLAQERFPVERAVRPVSLSEDEVRFLPDVPDAQLEAAFLGDHRGRQLLDVTIGAIWASGVDSAGRPMRERLSELLAENQSLYDDLLTDRLRRLSAALVAG
jgi:hypothetical protein